MDPVLVKRRLMSRAADISDSQYDRKFQTDIINLMYEPQWTSRTKMHDWRNYVDKEIQLVWSFLSEQARLSLYINAEVQARREE